MKKLLFISLLFIASCDEDNDTTNPSGSTSTVVSPGPLLPKPEHLIFVWFENKDYSQIIGSREAPYINSLIPEGTLFSHFYALGHPSYPQYLEFFCGIDNGKADDQCIDGVPYSNPNLYSQLMQKGSSFAWYSEGLPQTGSGVCYAGNYVERHNPTQCFSNVPPEMNKRWEDFPTDFNKLEQVVCISPDLLNDMHNGSIGQGDNWLMTHCSTLIEWCRAHHSVFVIYFDENNNRPGNHIPVIAVGQPVKEGYTDSTHYDHYSWTRTILAMHGAEPIANSVTRKDILNCWK
ncbi:MAG: alkaline phosphatase family protein [Bacteroidia bacterium]